MPLGSVERGNLDRRAERRLGHVEAQRQQQVVAVALEHLVRPHAQIDVEIARRTAAQPGVALAREPHLRAIGHAGGDVHLQPAVALLATDAAAGVAGMLDHRAFALAGLAGRYVDEATEDVALHPPHLAGAVADRTGGALRPRLGPAPAADRAMFQPRGANLLLRAEDRLGEVEFDLNPQIAAAHRPGRPAPAEEGVEDIAEAAEVEALEAAALGKVGGRAVAVVLGPLLRVREHLIRRRNALELSFSRRFLSLVGHPVGVMLHRQLAKGTPDVVLRSGALDTENLVEVVRGGIGHRGAVRFGQRSLGRRGVSKVPRERTGPR